MNQHTILGSVLNKLLSTKRPHTSVTNAKITAWIQSMLPFDLQAEAFLDGANNLHVDARTSDKHRTLFVAHIDTVHRSEGKNKITKTKTHWCAKGDVLGADDGAGVALLMHMIHHNVPGYYIFTQGEERGGIGARYLATKERDLLSRFDRAIAFDRRGIDSVITHQGWGRCCSDTFGTALCEALMSGSDNLMMLNDDTGVYTDTAEFVDIIPECTNISVGYDKEHTQQESLNLVHYEHLAAAVLAFDWDVLPVERDPSIQESKYDDYKLGGWWQEYRTYTGRSGKRDTYIRDYDYGYTGYGHDSHAANSPFVPGYDDYTDEEVDEQIRREDAIDAVLDAQYGYTDALALLIGEAVYPEDVALVVKHLNFKQLDPRALDEAYEALEAGADIDSVLTTIFDEIHAS